MGRGIPVLGTPCSCQHTRHGCRAKDVAQVAADSYRRDFDSFAALASCSLTTAVPSTETNSPWDPPNPGLALPLPAEPTASDGHLPKVLIWHHSGVRTCPATAGTCPVCTVVCDRVAFDKLPFSSLTTPAPPRTGKTWKGTETSDSRQPLTGFPCFDAIRSQRQSSQREPQRQRRTAGTAELRMQIEEQKRSGFSSM